MSHPQGRPGEREDRRVVKHTSAVQRWHSPFGKARHPIRIINEADWTEFSEFRYIAELQCLRRILALVVSRDSEIGQIPVVTVLLNPKVDGYLRGRAARRRA